MLPYHCSSGEGWKVLQKARPMHDVYMCDSVQICSSTGNWELVAVRRVRKKVRKAASRGLKAKLKRVKVKVAKWPEESADSDDGQEDEVEDEKAVDPESGEHNAVVGATGTEEKTYPDAASHQRKLKLLGYVRHLTIASIAVTRYAMRIVYTFLNPRGTPPEVERTATVELRASAHLGSGQLGAR